MKKVRIYAAVAAAALGISVVAIPPVVQGEDTSTPGGSGGTQPDGSFLERVPAGELHLETDDGNRVTVRYVPPTSGDSVIAAEEPNPVSQLLANRDKCRVETALFAQLLEFGTPVTAGLVSNGLGSTDGRNCSSGNGRLAAGESLELELGSAFPDDVFIDFATLDIEAKFNAGVDHVTNGETPAVCAVDEGSCTTLGTSSDNGNDSGPGDNNTIVIGVEGPADDFTSLTLSPVSDDGRGEIALEGGGDYPVPADHRTVLTLVRSSSFEYALGCPDEGGSVLLGEIIDPPDLSEFNDLFEGDTSPLPGPDDPDVPVSVKVRRYETDPPAAGKARCRPIGVDLTGEIDPELTTNLGVLFDNSDASDQDLSLRIEFIWYVYQAPGITLDDVPDRKIDLDPFDETPAQEGSPCLSYVGPADAFDADDPGVVERPVGADLPWCLVLDQRTPQVIDGVPVIVQRQVWDGAGDPRWL